jgi:hypothetical protein
MAIKAKAVFIRTNIMFTVFLTLSSFAGNTSIRSPARTGRNMGRRIRISVFTCVSYVKNLTPLIL